MEEALDLSSDRLLNNNNNNTPNTANFREKHSVIFYQKYTDFFKVNSTSVILPLNIRVKFSET